MPTPPRGRLLTGQRQRHHRYGELPKPVMLLKIPRGAESPSVPDWFPCTVQFYDMNSVSRDMEVRYTPGNTRRVHARHRWLHI